MRRFICIVSAFTLLLAGCVKNEPLTSGWQEPKAEIAFESPIVAPKTKSVQEIASGFPTTLDMKVWGFFSETEFPAVDAINHTVVSHRYMLGAHYINEGTVWGCNDRGYYWPHSGYLHFVAFAPTVPAERLTASDVTDEGLQLTGYILPDEADEDLLVSRVAYSQTKPANPEDGAPLVFDHALTSILFQVKSGVYGDRTSVDPDRLDTDLRIVKIEVRNARATGDFSQQMTSWNNEQMSSPAAAQNPEKGWTVADNAAVKTFVAYDGTESPLTRAASAGGLGMGSWGRGQLLTDEFESIHDLYEVEDGYRLTNLILLPQVIKDSVLLRVTYDMTHSDLADINGEENLWIRNQVVEIPMNQCGITEWLRGYRYVYNLTLSLGKIQCSIDTVPWDEYETLEHLDTQVGDLDEKLFE
jgi:hypothetical protein